MKWNFLDPRLKNFSYFPASALKVFPSYIFPKNTRSKKISYIFLKKAFPIFWEMKLSYISGNGTF